MPWLHCQINDIERRGETSGMDLLHYIYVWLIPSLISGAVIGFEYNGDGCCAACQEALVAINKGSTGLVFASATPQAAAAHINNFYNFVDIQMTV